MPAVAFYVGLNIEHYHVDVPATSIFPGTAALKPDPLNYGWRDYGPRVGIWRMIELLDRLEIPASVLLNSEVCVENPEIIAAGLERNWSWVAHGTTNSRLHANFETRSEEAEAVAGMFEQLERSTGTRPRGWMGPALTETFDTPESSPSSAAATCSTVQRRPALPTGRPDRMISRPVLDRAQRHPAVRRQELHRARVPEMVIDWFDQLCKDGESTGRVMTVGLHPFIANQPSRHRYLEEALEYIAGHDGVWMTTTDAIADHYFEHYYDGAVDALAQRNRA